MIINSVKKILVGSKYFFNNFEDFVGHDEDYISFLSGDKFVKPGNSMIVHLTYPISTDLITYNVEDRTNMLQLAKESHDPYHIGKFLIPELCEYCEITLEDVIREVGDMFNELDETHYYQKIIYDAYVENNSMTLTEDQLNAAYESYKTSREIPDEDSEEI